MKLILKQNLTQVHPNRYMLQHQIIEVIVLLIIINDAQWYPYKEFNTQYTKSILQQILSFGASNVIITFTCTCTYLCIVIIASLQHAQWYLITVKRYLKDE